MLRELDTLLRSAKGLGCLLEPSFSVVVAGQVVVEQQAEEYERLHEAGSAAAVFKQQVRCVASAFFVRSGADIAPAKAKCACTFQKKWLVIRSAISFYVL
jgi:hypothetical protein